MFKFNSIAPAKILAVETSNKILSVTCSKGDGVLSHLGELSFNVGYKHSSLLKETCQFLIGKVGWKINELTHLAVSTGPGSFTGLRVGISFMRALSSALKIPLIGIPTFELIAHQFRDRKYSSLTVLIDSIGEDLFMGSFKSGRHTPSEPYRVIQLSSLLKKGSRKTVFAGEGFLRYEKEISAVFHSQPSALPLEMHFPRAKECAELAFQKIQTKRLHAKDWAKVVPFYLRPPLAIERFKK